MVLNGVRISDREKGPQTVWPCRADTVPWATELVPGAGLLDPVCCFVGAKDLSVSLHRRREPGGLCLDGGILPTSPQTGILLYIGLGEACAVTYRRAMKHDRVGA